MERIVQRLKQMLLSLVGFGLIEDEIPSSAAPSVIENLKSDLVELRAAAVRVIANHYRIERLLKAEERKLEHLQAEAEMAAPDGEQVESLLALRIQAHKARVDDLREHLESAKHQSVEARLQVDQFEEKLQETIDEVHDARVRYQLATMKAQLERFAFSGSRDKDLEAIERIKEKADLAQAEADALVELRDALGLTEGDSGEVGR